MLAIFFYLILSLRRNSSLRSQIISTFVTILDLYLAFDCDLTITYSFAIACVCIASTRALDEG
jgi:hypothetical protein